MRTPHLNPTTRAQALRALARTSAATPLDILVIGGGVTGAGIAFDAATRGLDVGIIEAHDWASGTSSRSSKLVHGGLRYLEMLDFPLVAEALHERDLLLTRTAPHLVRALPFVFPFETPLTDRAYIGTGVALYDAMAARPGHRRGVPLHRHLGAERLHERFPGIGAEHGGIEYFDAQVDDARFTQLLVRSAVAHGALAASRVRAVGYVRESAGKRTVGAEADTGAGEHEVGHGRIVGVRVHDAESGDEFDIHARATILATSVWTPAEQHRAHEATDNDVPEHEAPDDEAPDNADGSGRDDASRSSHGGLRVLASKGIHITVPQDRIKADGDVGVITRTDTSVLFIIPWDDLWLIGTTDTPWHEDVSTPLVTSTDIDRVLANVNSILTVPLTRDDVVGTFAGLRPLVQPPTDESDSTRVSREHAITEVAPGLSAIAGGKLTTYRVMAEDAVDFALRDRAGHARSRTGETALLGAEPVTLSDVRRRSLRDAYGWDDTRFDRLIRRHGSLLGHLLELVDARPELGRPLDGAEHYIAAEALCAATSEGALHLEDILHRRLRLEFEVPDRGIAAARPVAELVSETLGWDEDRIAEELDRFTRHVEVRREAEQVVSDAEAADLVARAERAAARAAVPTSASVPASAPVPAAATTQPPPRQ